MREQESLSLDALVHQLVEEIVTRRGI
jgi:hypothetical protein